MILRLDAISTLPGNRNSVQQIDSGLTKLSSDGWKHSMQATFPTLYVDSREQQRRIIC